MRKKFLHLAMALGLVTGLLVGAIAPAAAAPEEPGFGAIYFPWVPNDDSLAGIDGITGSVTVQNLEPFAVDVTLYDADYNELTDITLNPRASQTWTADQLGIAAPGSGVVAAAEWANVGDLILAGVVQCENEQLTVGRGTPANSTDTVAVSDVPTFVYVDGYAEGTDFNWTYSGGNLLIDWSPAGAEPAAETEYTVSVYYCDEIPFPRIAGAEKHTTGTVGPRTSANTEIVDGYTALPVQDLILATGVTSFPEAWLDLQSRWIIPIAQTNNNWNTEIVITNVSGVNNSVNATFYAAGGQGSAGESVALLSGETLGPGESITVDLREDAGFPDEVVGSVWIDATHAVVAAAFRNKPSTEMMLTTLAQPRNDDPINSPALKFGPLVFRDYNGWNTGINIANLSSVDNTVSVTYYNYAGNVVHVDTITIPARAMEYIYTMATGSEGLAERQITSARIEGSAPLAVAVDEVKYLEGQDQWHAMTYAAARAQFGGDAIDTGERVLYESMLGLPLVQKGNPTTGYGDTSGINLFNPSGDAVVAAVQFLDSAGVPVAPTVDATDAEKPLSFPMPAGAGATIYTLDLSEMPAGFQGSAVVGVVGDGALVGVSNNVNYEVIGDGSAVFNLAPTWVFDFEEPEEPEEPVLTLAAEAESEEVEVGGTANVIATVTDADGNPVSDIVVTCELDPESANSDAEVTGSGEATDENGQVTCSWTGEAEGDDILVVSADLDGDGDTEEEGETVEVTVTFTEEEQQPLP